MKEDVIKKIEKSNLSKDIKKQLVKTLKEEDYVSFLKIFYYSIGISSKLLDFFDIDLEIVKEIFNELLE